MQISKHLRIATLISVSVLTLALFVFLYGFEHYGRWTVLLADCPDSVSTGGIQTNGELYVLKQTHEPLFRISDGENYTSRILRTWSRTPDSSNYIFCPDTSLKFDEARAFSSEFFGNYIRVITKQFDPTAVITQKNECVDVSFLQPRKSYLQFLSDYAHAPTIVQSPKIERGLGPYFVQLLTPDKILLKRKKYVYHGYNTILMRRYNGVNDPQLADRSITDFNKISAMEIPPWVKAQYVNFQDATLNSVFMLINHPDANIRKIVYNCMAADLLMKAFVPDKTDFYNIATVLPVGLAGAQPGKPQQTCQKQMRASGTLVFANLRTGNEKQMQSFAESFRVKTGLTVKILNFTPPDFVAALAAHPKKYNLVIISADTSGDDTTPFLNYFDWIDYPLPHLKAWYDRLVLADDPATKARLTADIADGFAENHVVLPLYQNARSYYYPAGIKNIIVGRGFMEYPEVGDFRW